MARLVEGGVGGLGLDHVRAGHAPLLGRVLAVGEDRVQNAAGPAGGHQAAGVVTGGQRGVPGVQVERHGDDLGLELGRTRAHVPLQDVDVREQAEGLVHEVVVVVVAAVHRSRALAGLPERVFLRGHRAELGQDLFPARAPLRERSVDGEAVGVGVVAHRVVASSGTGTDRALAGGSRPSDPRLFNRVSLADTPVCDDGAVRRPEVFVSLHGYQRAWASADLVAGLTLLVIAVPEQLATSRLAGMPPITGFYAFVAGTVLFALLGSNPQMSVGADSTIAPLFAVGIAHLAPAGSAHYVDLVGILAVMVGVLVMLVSILRLGWIADFLSTPIVTGFMGGVAVIIVIHQLPDFLGLPSAGGSNTHRVGFVFTHLAQVNGWTVVIGLGVLAVMFVSAHLDRRIPGGLIGLVGSTALGGVLGLQAQGVAVLGTIQGGAPKFGLMGLP